MKQIHKFFLCQLPTRCISEESILTKKLMNNLDRINNQILKCFSPAFESLRASASKQSITERTYPASLRTAKVNALHKRGKISNPEIFRLIRFESVLEKIMMNFVIKTNYYLLLITASYLKCLDLMLAIM